MKNEFEKALRAKQAQRAKSAAAPIDEKLRTLNQLWERREQSKNAKIMSSTRGDKK